MSATLNKSFEFIRHPVVESTVEIVLGLKGWFSKIRVKFLRKITESNKSKKKLWIFGACTNDRVENKSQINSRKSSRVNDCITVISCRDQLHVTRLVREKRTLRKRSCEPFGVLVPAMVLEEAFNRHHRGNGLKSNSDQAQNAIRIYFEFGLLIIRPANLSENHGIMTLTHTSRCRKVFIFTRMTEISETAARMGHSKVSEIDARMVKFFSTRFGLQVQPVAISGGKESTCRVGILIHLIVRFSISLRGSCQIRTPTFRG
ncbi:hypothetical protein CLF_111695 [Clonorchis sinensis]|uniref:Uncharacterized protein n=1 Tax=Clonorchis sinensis TaxID=79923 RepID=G7YV78_CLOSI|nr:hypothetical protein CLF_111695 [Clonorchis sinensis]